MDPFSDSSPSSTTTTTTTTTRLSHSRAYLNHLLAPSSLTSTNGTSDQDRQALRQVRAHADAVLSILADLEIPDDERPDALRDRLVKGMKELDGDRQIPDAPELDAIVLSLLHRHREDLHPTGQTFPLPSSTSASLPSPSATSRPLVGRSASFRRALNPGPSSLRRSASGSGRPISPSPLRAQSPAFTPGREGGGRGSVDGSASAGSVEGDSQSESDETHGSGGASFLSPLHVHQHRGSSAAGSMNGSPLNSPRILNISASEFKPTTSATSQQQQPQQRAGSLPPPPGLGLGSGLGAARSSPLPSPSLSMTNSASAWGAAPSAVAAERGFPSPLGTPKFALAPGSGTPSGVVGGTGGAGYFNVPLASASSTGQGSAGPGTPTFAASSGGGAGIPRDPWADTAPSAGANGNGNGNDRLAPGVIGGRKTTSESGSSSDGRSYEEPADLFSPGGGVGAGIGMGLGVGSGKGAEWDVSPPPPNGPWEWDLLNDDPGLREQVQAQTQMGGADDRYGRAAAAAAYGQPQQQQQQYGGQQQHAGLGVSSHSPPPSFSARGMNDLNLNLSPNPNLSNPALAHLTGGSGMPSPLVNLSMGPFDFLAQVFANSDLTQAELEDALARNNYELERTIDWLSEHRGVGAARSASLAGTPQSQRFGGGGASPGLSLNTNFSSLSVRDNQSPSLRRFPPSPSLGQQPFGGLGVNLPPGVGANLTSGAAPSPTRLVGRMDMFSNSPRSSAPSSPRFGQRALTPLGGPGTGYMDQPLPPPHSQGPPGMSMGAPSPIIGGPVQQQQQQQGSMPPPPPSSRVCRFYLEDKCLRSDCRFSHDIERAVCRFWLRGHCLKANKPEGCDFLHEIPPNLRARIRFAPLDKDREREMKERDYNRERDFGPGQRGSRPTSIYGQPSPNIGAGPTGREWGQASANEYDPRGRDPDEDFPALSSTLHSSTSKRDEPASPAVASHHDDHQQQQQQREAGGFASSQSKAQFDAKMQNHALAQQQQIQAAQQAREREQQQQQQSAGSWSNGPPSSRSEPIGMGIEGLNGVDAGRSGSLPQSRASSRLTLRPPQLLPRIEPSQALQQMYAEYKQTLNELAAQRNKCLAKAGEAWKRQDAVGARRWTREAQEFNRQFSTQGREASTRIMVERKRLAQEIVQRGSEGRAARVDDEPDRAVKASDVGGGLGICLGVVSPNLLGAEGNVSSEDRTEALIDVQGLHTDEAIEFVDRFLLGLDREGFSGLAFIIVGESAFAPQDGARNKRPSEVVVEHIDAEGYPWKMWAGVVCIDPLGHVSA